MVSLRSELVLVDPILNGSSPQISGYRSFSGFIHDVETGQVLKIPERWPLLEWFNKSDPFDEVETKVGEHTIGHSRRGSAVMRWQFRGVHILRRVDMGQAFGPNERWKLLRGSSEEIEWNPNYMGALQKGDMKLYPSQPLHFLSGVNSDGAHFFEGAVIPLEFDSYGGEVDTHAVHGGGPNTPGIYPKMKQFKRLTLDWDGRDGVHELFFASYTPKAIPWAKDTACAFLASLWLTDIFQHRAVVYVPSPVTHLDLNNAEQFGERFQDHTRISFDFRARETRTSGTEFDTISTPPIFTKDGIMGVNMTSDDGAVSVGIASRIHPSTNGGTLTNEMSVSQLRTDGLTGNPDYDTNSGQRISFRSSGQSRQKGWLAMRFYIVTKTNPDSFQHVVNKLRTDGVFDAPLPMHYIPEHVW